MVELNEVSSINIQIADFREYGKRYGLYINKNKVSPQFLVKIDEISRKHGLSFTCSDSHYIIIQDRK
jgi:hypothetical protein